MLPDAERLAQQDEGDPRPDRLPSLTSKTSLAGAAHQYKVAEGTTPSLTQGRCGAVEDELGGGVWAAVELPDPEGVRRPDGAQFCVPVAAVIQVTDPLLYRGRTRRERCGRRDALDDLDPE